MIVTVKMIAGIRVKCPSLSSDCHQKCLPNITFNAFPFSSYRVLMCVYDDRYDVADGLIICSFPMRVRQKDFCVEYSFDIKYQRRVRRSYYWRKALCMRSEIRDSNLCRITGYLESTAKGSAVLFHLLTLPHSPYLCAHYLPYAIVCHSAAHHSDRKMLLKHLTSHALTTNVVKPRVTSSFRREVHENSALLGCYAESSGDSLPTFRYNLSKRR